MTAIATLGSHCSLQVLKGAKDEGLKTMLVCEKKREKLYRRFPFIDELIIVDSFKEVLDQKCQKTLEENNAVLIPHGTLIAQMNSEEIESIKTPVFGNKWILRWESDREMKEKLLQHILECIMFHPLKVCLQKLTGFFWYCNHLHLLP